ncbi:hypothetical protein EXIGLDRAFT_846757 [Exidia glandulosa HHB12029]|uniref:Uncharacterized protein n=1 Tax=Exidia glandulosa HHB12029 TaxID=1314781 RepID=A0A166NIH2_EXIGL|nr:hypothetical protein EXIGLDRAFT_846757 [Exidia glandulosa HHB12029]
MSHNSSSPTPMSQSTPSSTSAPLGGFNPFSAQPGHFDSAIGSSGSGFDFTDNQSLPAGPDFNFGPVSTQQTPLGPTAEELALQQTRKKLALFVDNLVSWYGLTDENRQELVNFCLLFSIAVDRHTIMLHAVRFAKDFRLERRLDTVEAHMKQIAAGVTDISTQINVNYSLPAQATKNIRGLTMQLIAQPDRVRYMDLADSVLEELQKGNNANKFGLDNVFDTPVRRQTLEAAVRRICSSVRNGFRQDIRDALGLGPKAMGAAKGLVVFAAHMARKYKPDDACNIVLDASSQFTIKLAILRSYGVEKADLLSIAEDEDQQAQAVPRGEKRKANSAGRVKKGSDFWSLTESHLAWLSTMYGEGRFDFMKPTWDKFIKDTVQEDMTRIPSSSNTPSKALSSSPVPLAPSPVTTSPAPPLMPFTNMLESFLN